MNSLVCSEAINIRPESQTKLKGYKKSQNPAFYLISVFELMASLRTIVPILTFFFFLFAFSEGKEFLVGGKEDSWTNPRSSDSLNLWAEENRFNVDDFLSNISSQFSLLIIVTPHIF